MRFLLLLLLLSILNFQYSNAQESGFLNIEDGVVSYQNIDNYLRPFKTDGCSSVSPDGTLGRPTLWQHCCVDHDIAYWKGGTLQEKNDADETLNQCVSEVFSGIYGRAMQVAVYIGGSPRYHTGYAWGYGWNHIRGYHELSESDQREIERMMPTDPHGQEVVSIEFDKERIPSKNDNICLDEIQDHIEKSLNISDIKILETTQALSFLNRVYVVETSACEGRFKVTLNNFVSFKECKEIPFKNQWNSKIKKVEAFGKCADKYKSKDVER